jgi:ABC-type polysaccharide/polyol phosphate transport system ATPase subunit
VEAGHRCYRPRAVSATIHGTEAGAARSHPGTHEPALTVSNVSKTFRLPHQQYHTLKERALHPFRRTTFDELHAVDNVSLEIAEGEFFGIVGRNGSGKSTLLKCLAGIYEIDTGEIGIRGRLSPFIELGVCFNPDLAARDNAIINAIMLGLTRTQAYERFDRIIEFAELEQFIDLKLKNYSSGMQVRLAFSTAIQVDADILLMDEVLAVGDASFQRKCFDEFARLKAAGRTIVLVTHDMGSVERFCDRAMLLERGRMIDIGEPESIARQYNDLNFKVARREQAHAGVVAAPAPAIAKIASARFESDDGVPIVSMAQGEPCVVQMEVLFEAEAHNPVFAVALRNEFGVTGFAAHSELQYGDSGHFRAGQLATIRLRFDNWLAPGRYGLIVTVTADGPAAEIYDRRDDLASIIVFASETAGGIVDLPHTFEVERGS